MSDGDVFSFLVIFWILAVSLAMLSCEVLESTPKQLRGKLEATLGCIALLFIGLPATLFLLFLPGIPYVTQSPSDALLVLSVYGGLGLLVELRWGSLAPQQPRYRYASFAEDC